MQIDETLWPFLISQTPTTGGIKDVAAEFVTDDFRSSVLTQARFNLQIIALELCRVPLCSPSASVASLSAQAPRCAE